MKKVVSLLLIAVMLISCVFTSCGDTNNTTSREKTGEEKLCEYVMQKGENNNGTHTVTQPYENGYFSITCTADKKLTFHSLTENENGNFYAELIFVNGSATHDVVFKYEALGYSCVANGMIKTNAVTSDVCEIFEVTYTNDFPEDFTPSMDQVVDRMFSPTVKLMLSQLSLTLAKDTDTTMSELGYGNWE